MAVSFVISPPPVLSVCHPRNMYPLRVAVGNSPIAVPCMTVCVDAVQLPPLASNATWCGYRHAIWSTHAQSSPSQLLLSFSNCHRSLCSPASNSKLFCSHSPRPANWAIVFPSIVNVTASTYVTNSSLKSQLQEWRTSSHEVFHQKDSVAGPVTVVSIHVDCLFPICPLRTASTPSCESDVCPNHEALPPVVNASESSSAAVPMASASVFSHWAYSVKLPPPATGVFSSSLWPPDFAANHPLNAYPFRVGIWKSPAYQKS